jgi:hypothetical protein
MARAQPKRKTPLPKSAPPARRKRGAHRAPGVPLAPTRQALRARRKFLRIFPSGFRDADYVDLERAYKWNAHLAWEEALGRPKFAALLAARRYADITSAAIRIESRTNLLFSFEKMALRDAVRAPASAEAFATALHEFLYGTAGMAERFTRWVETIDELPRRQTRVLTWPLVTVFGFIARPDVHFFFKPTVTREAARRYGVDLPYASRPASEIYQSLLAFVARVRGDIADLRPRDMIDLQSFLWVQGSDEYPD